MIQKLKKWFYFPVAHYFGFFARIKLARWKPRVVVVTGSSGKTTLMHMIEAQLGEMARYSHHANSTFGIPFHILGIASGSIQRWQWPVLFFLAPFASLGAIPKERVYIAEADAERPGEGEFLAKLLRPEVTLWPSLSRSHAGNFDYHSSGAPYDTLEAFIAKEFGWFAECTTKRILVNADVQEIVNVVALIESKKGIKVEYHEKAKHLDTYMLKDSSTQFVIDGEAVTLAGLHPEVVYYAIVLCRSLVKYFGVDFDPEFKEFSMPPSRGNVLYGIKDTTLVDSTYNAIPEGMRVMLDVFERYTAKAGSEKWLVLGDMVETGIYESGEHEKVAEQIASMNVSRVILLGPRMQRYALPILKDRYSSAVSLESFLYPVDVTKYFRSQITGRETILFKGARFLEGVVESLLEDPSDARKLCRREPVWQKRRKKWGL